MTPFGHPRRWAVGASVVLAAPAAWLLFVPLTAIYVSDPANPAPHELTSRYSWWTAEQNLLYSDAGPTSNAHQVNGVRLHCGSAFVMGPRVIDHIPDGPQGCAQVKTPRTIAALVVIALCGVVILTLRALPATGRTANHYTLSSAERRALRKSRR
jgi:hypothetical protein